MNRSTTRGRRAARIRVGTALTVSAALTVAACSSGGDSDGSTDASGEGADLTCAVEDFQADEQFTAPEPMELGILWTDWPDNPIKDTWEFFDEIEKRTNVSLDADEHPLQRRGREAQPPDQRGRRPRGHPARSTRATSSSSLPRARSSRSATTTSTCRNFQQVRGGVGPRAR